MHFLRVSELLEYRRLWVENVYRPIFKRDRLDIIIVFVNLLLYKPKFKYGDIFRIERYVYKECMDSILGLPSSITGS
jgi:hypothetical protein